MLWCRFSCSGKSEKTDHVCQDSHRVLTFITQVKYKRADPVQQGLGIMWPVRDINSMCESLSSRISYNRCMKFWLQPKEEIYIERIKKKADDWRVIFKGHLTRSVKMFSTTFSKSVVSWFRRCVWKWSENNTGKWKAALISAFSLHVKRRICESVRCVYVVRKLCLLASPSFSQMPYARLFLLALKETRAGWKCVSLLCPQAYSSGWPPHSLILELCV